MSDVMEKISNGDYTVTSNFRTLKGEARKKAALEYRKARAARDEEFRKDALEYVGLTGHPKADKAFDMAWDHCHSDGYSAVLYDLEIRADLIL